MNKQDEYQTITISNRSVDYWEGRRSMEEEVDKQMPWIIIFWYIVGFVLGVIAGVNLL